ncbi:MAG: roadblock/LC7 domain-containing protein, partial [bacterium]|nr:roadblock/LC7 domain-containing protein [bacterium]
YAKEAIKQDIGSSAILSANETENLLDSALEEINKINGVLGSIIIEESGLIIRSKVIENLDPEITAALFSTIFYVSEDSIAKVDLGMIDRVFIEIGKVRIYLFKGNGYILGIFTEEIVKIGLILIKAKQLLKNIKQVLE